MRFFCTNAFVTYPDDAAELQTQIIKDATKGPQKIPVAYFQDYFAKGGAKEHPLLGNLSEFADTIDEAYDSNKFGMNLVSGMLRHKLSQLTQQQENSSESPAPAGFNSFF